MSPFCVSIEIILFDNVILPSIIPLTTEKPFTSVNCIKIFRKLVELVSFAFFLYSCICWYGVSGWLYTSKTLDKFPRLKYSCWQMCTYTNAYCPIWKYNSIYWNHKNTKKHFSLPVCILSQFTRLFLAFSLLITSYQHFAILKSSFARPSILILGLD